VGVRVRVSDAEDETDSVNDADAAPVPAADPESVAIGEAIDESGLMLVFKQAPKDIKSMVTRFIISPRTQSCSSSRPGDGSGCGIIVY
jgi:hypothetical protein